MDDHVKLEKMGDDMMMIVTDLFIYVCNCVHVFWHGYLEEGGGRAVLFIHSSMSQCHML